MIDNYKKTMELIEKIKNHLPIPIVPTKDLFETISENKLEVPLEYNFHINSVVYLGDEGGIACELSFSKRTETVFITSLTHLRIHSAHPLSRDIKKYQKKRTMKLAKQRW